MNAHRMLVKLLIGGAIGSSLALRAIALNIEPTSNDSTSIAQFATSLSPEQVNLRAKQITVRIDGASTGSGAIIESSGNTYTVISNWHVMKNPGAYSLQTIDGRVHQVNPASIKQLPGLDLAVLQFTSNQNYQIADLGDSGNVTEGQNVYFAGYPGELRREDNRYYRFFAANIVGILPRNTENGYSLIYNGEAFPGMSGGPVLDRSGLLIGIHGEANIQALTGGTSNYAIPINSFKQAIASLGTEPTAATPQPPSQEESPTATTPQPPNQEEPPTAETSEPPEVTVDVEFAEDKPSAKPPESNPESKPENNSLPASITSVPTFEDSNENENTEPEAPQSPENEDNTETVENTKPETTSNSETAANPNEENIDILNEPWSSESNNSAHPPTTANVSRPQPITLVSRSTGIDYTSLRDLLKEQKWEEADRQTYQLIDRIIKTAKNKNQRMFIELKTIAEFSCNDIRTIDALWKKYSDNKFGFSSQQKVWQSVNQNGDFSTQTWRRFATEVGWKEGDVASGSGYLLYEQLNFDPQQAPEGHLPWWFALPDEQQNVIKHLFARCDFNPRLRKPKPNNENAAESSTELDKPKPETTSQ